MGFECITTLEQSKGYMHLSNQFQNYVNTKGGVN